MFEPFTIPQADPHLIKLGIHRNRFNHDFVEISKDLYEFQRIEDEKSYMEIIRTFGKKDLFFLMYFVMELPVNDPFIIARIYEAQENHHMTLDLWARFHWKSTILTYALPIFNLISHPTRRIGIFSHTKAMAKSHLRKIKHQLEQNMVLLTAFQDIFYMKQSQAPKWSEDEGIYVKRKGSFNEASVEAVGLIELPTGKHYNEAIYDDIIDLKNVETYAQLQKVKRYYEMSFGCLDRHCIKRVVGTRYDYKDIYGEIMKKKTWKTRIYPGSVDEEGVAKIGGIPTMMTREELDALMDEMGLYVFSSQILQKPEKEESQKFNEYWLGKRWNPNSDKPNFNYYIIVDPASKKKTQSDWTSMWVIGTDPYRNYWLLDGVRDKLSLVEKWDRLIGLVESWGGREVGYEEYGMQADIEFLERMMAETGKFFTITPLGGKVAKVDRIKRLIPDFQKGRWILPETLIYTDVKGIQRDLMNEYVEEEYKLFPNGLHDDMLDCQARIYDEKMNVFFPKMAEVEVVHRIADDPLDMGKKRNRAGSWMAIY